MIFRFLKRLFSRKMTLIDGLALENRVFNLEQLQEAPNRTTHFDITTMNDCEKRLLNKKTGEIEKQPLNNIMINGVEYENLPTGLVPKKLQEANTKPINTGSKTTHNVPRNVSMVLLGISHSKLWNLQQEGKLTVRKEGHYNYYSLAEINDLISKRLHKREGAK